MSTENNETVRNMGIVHSFTIFISASIALFLETKYLIPYLSNKTGQETILFWFIVAGLGIFLPLIILAWEILRREGYRLNKNTWKERLRFKRMTIGDWLWSGGALIVIGILSLIIMKTLEFAIGDFDHSPPFMSFEPLSHGRYWLLIVWLPYWILNIMGEEILWRGVILPRQEIVHGKYTWLIHGIGWGIFHVAFGWQLLLTLLPIFFVQSYVVQKRKNSWIGVIIHGGLNGPSFIAISLGLL
ncbi:CPBP family intramembrane glutamic endopeptidase [Candidatus Latescibacterota bacterium]